jgi:drug/metabolite transporter (DMT)-like permease
VIAILSSNIILDEVPNLTTVFGGVLLIYAVYLLNGKPN